MFKFDINNHDKAVYAHCLNVAKKDKEWAIKKDSELNGGEWEASEVSKNMLNEYLTSTVEEMAIKTYEYFNLRSHASFGSDKFKRPIDPQAFDLWTKLTGKKPF